MKKEKHIQVGDIENFKWSVNTLTQNKVSHFPPETIAGFYGLPIVQDTRIPKNRALLMSEKGEVLQIFDLPDFAREIKVCPRCENTLSSPAHIRGNYNGIFYTCSGKTSLDLKEKEPSNPT